MASTLTWVLLGIGLYTVAMLALRARGLLPNAVRVSGPIVTIHTQRGRDVLDWLASRRRLWRAWGNIGVGMALVVMALSAVVVVLSALSIASDPQTATIQSPQNALVIPGVNEFLPLSAAPEIVLGLVLGLIVHEGGHGLLCRVEDIDIESLGLALFAFIPIGAFVAPDEASRERADRGAQTRMFAAGVANNFALTAVAFVLLFGPIVGSVSLAAGVPVGDSFRNSAAADAGLEKGDLITGVGEAGGGVTNVSNATELDAALDQIESPSVDVRIRDDETVTVRRSLVVTDAVPEVLAGVDLEGGPPVIHKVNDTAVRTEREFTRAVRNRSVATLHTDGGNVTVPVGAFASQAVEDGPLAAEGAPTDSPLVVTRIDGQRVPNATALTAVLAGVEPGSSATVEAFVDGERRTYDVTLGERDGEAFLGVAGIRQGHTGLVLDDFGVDQYPAGFFLSVLDGSAGNISDSAGFFAEEFVRIFLVLFLPVFGIAGSGSFGFAGFTGGIGSFFVVEGPLAFLGSGVFLLANVCFWTGWVNFNLAIFNCIPAYPLDGGHILRTSTESVVSRLPISNRRRITSTVTTAITLSMIAALFLMLFGPQLLS
jgi:membrane-associated protease RseP (regulator of RpoE activity)